MIETCSPEPETFGEKKDVVQELKTCFSHLADSIVFAFFRENNGRNILTVNATEIVGHRDITKLAMRTDQFIVSMGKANFEDLFGSYMDLAAWKADVLALASLWRGIPVTLSTWTSRVVHMLIRIWSMI